MRVDRIEADAGLKSAVGVTGLLAAISTGLLVLFTLGAELAIVLAVTILTGAVLAAALAGRNVARAVAGLATAILTLTVVIGGYGVMQIALALTGSGSTPAPRPDPIVLGRASDKIDSETQSVAFRLELTEEELNAILQDALADANNPFRRITVDITNTTDETGRVDFVGEFKEGRLDIEGSLRTSVSHGLIDVEILAVDVGMFTVPSIARGALEDMIADLADLQAALAREGADVQDILIGDDRVVVTGTNRSAGVIDSSLIFSAVADRFDLGPGEELTPRYPAGRVNSTATEGDSYYVALGDSLAANVGVEEPRDGYVSRFHGWLETEAGVELGLRNFGIPGETSGSLLAAGQMDDALEFGRANFVSYVTIDIGANDLLGHLTSPDCGESISTLACEARIEASLEAYEENIASIFGAIARGFPDATVIVLTTYNPFGFGLEGRVAFEDESNTVIQRLNTIAAEEAEIRGFTVADGFGPMRGLATSATHMVDSPPDIHPNVAGYDLLAGALIRTTE